MNKEYKAKMLPMLKQVDTQHLQHSLLNGIMLASLCPPSENKAFRNIGEQMFLIKKELKTRGIKTVKEDTLLGLRIRFEKAEDTLAKQDVKMKIPTITELLAQPLPTDLPKHGYVTIQLPEKN